MSKRTDTYYIHYNPCRVEPTPYEIWRLEDDAYYGAFKTRKRAKTELAFLQEIAR